MLVICNGLPRSASTWSFNVVLRLLRGCFPGQHVHSGYSDKLVEFVKQAPAATRHVVMKSHYLTPYGQALIRSGAAKVVYTWRDVPDAIASGLRAFGGVGTTFEDFLKSFDAALPHYKFHRESGNAVIVGYDEVLSRASESIERIGVYLGLDNMTSEIIDGIAEETSIEQMRRIVLKINSTADNRLLPGSLADPETLLRRNHIHDGRPGYGRKILTATQLSRIDALCARHEFF